MLLAAVFFGGCAGTALRAALEDAFPAAPGQWPWTTFSVNVIGALCLGILLEVLVSCGPDRGIRRLVRLGVGTGVLGGFTTYSTFMVETARMHWPIGLAYVVLSTVLGVLAASVGIRAGRTAWAAGGDTP